MRTNKPGNASPLEAFSEWLTTYQTAGELRRGLLGRRVRYVGMSGEASGPTGTITGVAPTGVRIRPDKPGSAGPYHPEDLRFL